MGRREAASDGRACTASLFLFWRSVTPTDVTGDGRFCALRGANAREGRRAVGLAIGVKEKKTILECALSVR